LVYKNHNLNIIGGKIANKNSWPSVAYIKFSYKSYVHIKGFDDIFLKEFSSICGGNLIRRDVVLTSVKCMPSKVDFDYLGVAYSIKVVPNRFFPTFESMISVHLGLHDRSTIRSSPLFSYSYYADGGVEFDVERIIKVICFNFYLVSFKHNFSDVRGLLRGFCLKPTEIF
jgi:hypothetical protein